MTEFNREETLADVRASLERHPAPDVPYFIINEIERSARDLLREMEQGTSIGEAFLQEWAEMKNEAKTPHE